MRMVRIFGAVAMMMVLATPYTAVSAQTGQASPTAGGPVIDDTLPDVRTLSSELTAQGDQLRDGAAEALKRADDLERKLKELQADKMDLGVAKKNVGEIINLLRTAQNRLAPENTYRKLLEKADAMVRDLGSIAEAHTDSEVRRAAGYFRQTLGELAGLQNGAEETRTRLMASADRLERMLDRLAITRTIAGIEEFLQTARAYLENMRALGDRAVGLANKLENYGRPPATQ
jgi:hypothetical protein